MSPQPQVEENVSTMSSVLERARYSLEESGATDSPLLDAELLLAHLLCCNRSALIIYPERQIEASKQQEYADLISRRAAGEPVAYIVGFREFWSIQLTVTSDVLIPRPETELLVEQALLCCDSGKETILDLGTGSGAIAIALASELPEASVVAVDRSEAALSVARANAERLEIQNIRFALSDWFSNVGDQRFDLIVANPPYIEPDDPHLLGEVRFEPGHALVAVDKGLADLAKIIGQAGDYLLPGGSLMVEHGFNQGAAVRQLLTAAGFSEVKTVTDLSGNDRVGMGSLG